MEDFSRDIIERLLFRTILTDKTYMSICDSIFDKRWIKTPNLAIAFQLAINFYKKYNRIPDPKIVKAIVKKVVEKRTDISYKDVCDIIDDSVTLNLQLDKDILAKNLKTFIRKQALWCSIFDNVEDIEKNSDDVLDKCLKRFDDVNRITFNDADLGMNYFNEADLLKHWEYITNPEDKISTGWGLLDFYTNGGFLKSGRMLGLFVGQAGLGKSLFLSNLAVNLLRQNLSVVVISLEMSQDVYAQRFDAHISEKNINRLKENKDIAQARIMKFYEDHPKANLFIKEYPPRSIKCSDIDAYLENLKLAGYHFDVVIVDYLNLICASRQSDNMFTDGLEVSEKLRALSYKYLCPVISATQVNTAGMNNEDAGMENISQSRGIAHTADFISVLFQRPEDRESGIINMRILKNRLGGQVGKVIPFSMNPENLVLTDISFDKAGDSPDQIESTNEADSLIKNLPSISSDIDSI